MQNFKELTEEELLSVAKNWGPREFIEYYSRLYGVMSMEEFHELNMTIIDELFPK
jgi:hypothetical protein